MKRLFILLCMTVLTLSLVGCDDCPPDEQGRPYKRSESGACVPANRKDIK